MGAEKGEGRHGACWRRERKVCCAESHDLGRGPLGRERRARCIGFGGERGKVHGWKPGTERKRLWGLTDWRQGLDEWRRFRFVALMCPSVVGASSFGIDRDRPGPNDHHPLSRPSDALEAALPLSSLASTPATESAARRQPRSSVHSLLPLPVCGRSNNTDNTDDIRPPSEQRPQTCGSSR